MYVSRESIHSFVYSHNGLYQVFVCVESSIVTGITLRTSCVVTLLIFWYMIVLKTFMPTSFSFGTV